jgi:hypothetical protein
MTLVEPDVIFRRLAQVIGIGSIVYNGVMVVVASRIVRDPSDDGDIVVRNFERRTLGDLDVLGPRRRRRILSGPGGNFPTAMPIALSAADRTKANNIYDHWGQSISRLEHSPDVSPFTSKFDAFLMGNYTLTADEMAGYNCSTARATAIHATLTADPPC